MRLKGIWSHYKDRQLTTNDMNYLFKVFILPFIYGAAIQYFIYTTEWSDLSTYYIKLFFLIAFIPAFLLFFHIYQHVKVEENSKLDIFLKWFLILCNTVAISFTIAMYNITVNALMGDGQIVWVGGPVIKKNINSSRWTGMQHVVYVNFDGRRIGFLLSANEYAATELGDVRGREMIKGGLGYYYYRERMIWR